MLNSGKKFNILTLVLSEKKILNEAKNHNPPFKLNGRSLILVQINYIFSENVHCLYIHSIYDVPHFMCKEVIQSYLS
jgi:hypothetical protein